ncbi:GNAT family N-acetyltransferase [Methylobacterium sp. 391_Methyba4]|uniref:GNAT family N-acetyltransferase n=1 Tax=Methylobacterium sp. 391_Methyba4 TaxID=3038924 RepID=UPI00241F57EF|nr:GNAT family N-acetyltransferase [Methylobacterium sp. 391_Methyba4]WFS05404.1 GNAT family N-acetyltransferase [Methylobacterium sp. 391_Methyba4]
MSGTDAAAFRGLRLEGLHEHPEAFGASWEDEARQSEAEFAARLDSGVVFGAKTEDAARLDVIVGIHRPTAAKIKHKAVIWGMYVRAEARRFGLGAALLRAAIEHATLSVEELTLSVGAENKGALDLYKSAGFRKYGLELRALKIGNIYYDEVLMSLSLSEI